MWTTRTLQVKLALKTTARKRALAHYKRFMLTAKPTLKMSWSDTEMEQLAAIMMQAAWRRRQVLSPARRCGLSDLPSWLGTDAPQSVWQAYFVRKRAENSRPFRTRMKTKLGVRSIDDDRLLHLAATCIQCRFRCRTAYFEVKQLAEKRAAERERAAATKMQALWRGGKEREAVKMAKQTSKVRRLAFFFTNVCFVKCFMTWERHTQVRAGAALGDVREAC